MHILIPVLSAVLIWAGIVVVILRGLHNASASDRPSAPARITEDTIRLGEDERPGTTLTLTARLTHMEIGRIYRLEVDMTRQDGSRPVAPVRTILAAHAPVIPVRIRLHLPENLDPCSATAHLVPLGGPEDLARLRATAHDAQTRGDISTADEYQALARDLAAWDAAHDREQTR